MKVKLIDFLHIWINFFIIFIIFFFLIPKLWKQKLVYPASLVLCYQGYNHFFKIYEFWETTRLKGD